MRGPIPVSQVIQGMSCHRPLHGKPEHPATRSKRMTRCEGRDAAGNPCPTMTPFAFCDACAPPDWQLSRNRGGGGMIEFGAFGERDGG